MGARLGADAADFRGQERTWTKAHGQRAQRGAGHQRRTAVCRGRVRQSLHAVQCRAVRRGAEQ